MSKEEMKLTPLEKKWVLYDVANSAFTLLIATIIPIYFNGIASAQGLSDVDYLAYWGYAASIATLLVALVGPFFGTLSDGKNKKLRMFIVALAIGAIGCVALGLAKTWLVFLAIFVLAKVAYQQSLIFYDSMLNDVTTPERADVVSSKGYAWGYIGSCIPFVLCLVIVLMHDKIGLTMDIAMLIAFAITSIWWEACAVPLIKSYEQKNYVENISNPVKDTFMNLFGLFKELKGRKDIMFFLIAFFFYIDGVYTIIDMATAYGEALGLDSTGLLLALLLTQIVAFPCSLIFAKLSKKIKSETILTICIFAYVGIAVFAFFLDTLTEFWILAFCVGMFQGTIQAMSRSYYSRIIPPEKSGEYFGLYDIFGKGAAFTGTMLISVVTTITGSTNKGVSSLSIMFIIGFLLFRVALKERKKYLNKKV